jgi:hypothetical protein
MAIVVPIVSEWNPKGVDRSLADIQRAEGGWAKTGKAFEAAFVPATAALAGLGALAYKTAQDASDLNEAASKSEVIFGDASAAIKDWAKTASDSFGMSQEQALSAASTFATFGKGAGLTGQDLGSFSTDLTELATDLASFNNTTTDEAIQALGAALRGESEPIRKYGVMLDDATLRQEALAMGIVDTTKNALTPQQKTLAAQSVIMKQTADAQGDFERTSEGAANQQRILEAKTKDASATMGQAFLPILEAALPLLSSFAGWVRDNSGVVTGLVFGLGALAGAIVAVNVGMKAWQAATVAWKAAQMAATAVQWAWNAAMAANPIGIVIIAIVALVAALVWLWKNNETFRKVVLAVWEKVKTGVSSAVNWLIAAWNKMLAVVRSVWSGMKSAILTVWDWMKRLFAVTPLGLLINHWDDLLAVVRRVWDSIKSAISNAVSRIKGILQPLIDLIRTVKDGLGGILGSVGGAIGGIFGRSASAAGYGVPGVAAYGLGGPTAASGGGPQINVYGALDPESTARQIRALLTAQDGRQGRVYGAKRAVAW